MLGQARLSGDEMHTAIIEVESILNSRPLTYMSSADVEEPPYTFPSAGWQEIAESTG